MYMEKNKNAESSGECGSKRVRYAILDGICGIAILHMITYHTIWDLVYLFDMDIGWYRSGLGYIWQQYI